MEKENLFLNCSFFNTSWEDSLVGHQNGPFESALSSIVCSPTASNAGNGGDGNFNQQNILIKNLIGRLGSICNSSEISAAYGDNCNSAEASRFNTPVTSPRRINSSDGDIQRIRENLLKIPGDGFHYFTNNFLVTDQDPDGGKIYGSPTFARQQLAVSGDSRENSSLSELIPTNPRKRKASSTKGKGNETSAIPPAKRFNAPLSEEHSSYSERGDSIKVKPSMNNKQNKDDSRAPEPPKDYIHVRARRGQATDAHSLAERVRREKISGRMKILQDLVPGCNKIAGKAVMLDEIINYVQSLQMQVEFLSMKLATVTPRMQTTLIKDMCQARGSFHQYVNPSQSYCILSQTDNSHGAIPITNGMDSHFTSPLLDGVTTGNNNHRNMFCEDDLHTVVQMGFREDESQKFHGVLKPTQMKMEH